MCSRLNLGFGCTLPTCMVDKYSGITMSAHRVSFTIRDTLLLPFTMSWDQFTESLSLTTSRLVVPCAAPLSTHKCAKVTKYQYIIIHQLLLLKMKSMQVSLALVATPMALAFTSNQRIRPGILQFPCVQYQSTTAATDWFPS